MIDKKKSEVDKIVSEFFNNIIAVCKKYDGYAVTPEEKKIMPEILRKYIQENKPLFGDIFVLSLCRDLGYSDSEIEPLKNMKLWKELCEIGYVFYIGKKI
jgi:hypothetical protein